MPADSSTTVAADGTTVIEGTLTYQGSAVPNAPVALGPSPRTYTCTDDEGGFVFTDVEPGDDKTLQAVRRSGGDCDNGDLMSADGTVLDEGFYDSGEPFAIASGETLVLDFDLSGDSGFSDDGPVNVTTSGLVERSETCSGEIHITGDITLAPGATLTIEPGTTVYLASLSDDQNCCAGQGFADAYTIDNDDPTDGDDWNVTAIVIDGRQGRIWAIGTPDERIVFRPEGDSTSPAQWDGLILEEGSVQYADLWYPGHVAIEAIPRQATLGPFEPEIEIAHNHIIEPLWVGLQAGGPGVWIHHNTVEGGGHQGILVSMNSVAEHNIVMRSQTCIAFERSRGAVVRNNILIDCGRGIEMRSGPTSEVRNNTIVRIDGPPDGWYFQGELVYPVFDQGGGVEDYVGGDQRIIVDNIVYGPYDWGLGLHVPLADGSVVDRNLMFGQPQVLSGPGSGFAGPTILTADPRFADPDGGDFTLGIGSPAIDAGDPDLADPDGSPVDLGAHGGPGGSWE